MEPQIPTWLGVLCEVLLGCMVVFVFFAFRKGLQVKRPPEGVPPERTTGP